MLRKTIQVAAVLVLMMGTSTAGAVVITFESLTGSNGDSFSSTTEAGFEVTAITDYWNEAHVFGNPTPSIWNDSSLTGTIQVEDSGGGLFSLNSVDFGCGNGAVDDCTGTVEGLLGGAQQFLVNTALLDNNGTFSTFLPGVNAIGIDTLLISINRRDSNIDNIDLTQLSVPEPSVLALMAIGLAGIGFARRKKT
jgi:hypothetical protein